MSGAKPIEQKRKHHYVPVAYLQRFSDHAGRLLIYRKDKPDLPPASAAPKTVAFEEYFYSQPLQDGGQDNNTLEDFFSVLEGRWAELVGRLARKEDINADVDGIETLFNFIALQRVRVPAYRDGAEAIQAELIREEVRQASEAGLLPPPPVEFAHLLSPEKLNVNVHPHESILAMPAALEGIADLFSRIGLCLLENLTQTPFLTSDNPVAWYDPSVAEASRLPYSNDPGGEVEFFFPITPELAIYGNSGLVEDSRRYGFTYQPLVSTADVEMFNRTICRFAYRAVFAQKRGQEDTIREHSALSPIVRTRILHAGLSRAVIYETVFGPRPSKAKPFS